MPSGSRSKLPLNITRKRPKVKPFFAKSSLVPLVGMVITVQAPGFQLAVSVSEWMVRVKYAAAFRLLRLLATARQGTATIDDVSGELRKSAAGAAEVVIPAVFG